MNNEALEEGIGWLEQAVKNIRYGSATLTVIVHDRRIQRIERTLMESVLAPQRGAGYGK